MPCEVLMFTAEVNCNVLTQEPSTETGAVQSHESGQSGQFTTITNELD